MASWKELGEVPDSDDDDDSRDSQGIAGNEDLVEEQLRSAYGWKSSFNEDPGDLEQGDGCPPAALGLKGQHAEACGLSTDVRPQKVDIGIEGAQRDPTASTVRLSTNKDEEHVSCSSTSQEYIPVFQVPRTFLDYEDGVASYKPGEGPLGNLRNERLEAERPLEDDISRTFARITSPASSLTADPLLSQHLTSSLPRSNPPMSPDALLAEATPEGTNSNNLSAREFSTQILDAPLISKRSLRHRNPIQLHPYVVEQEKYRRILKARGLTPMRISASQDDAQRSPDKPTQARKSSNCRESIEPGESQSMEQGSNSAPQSSGLMLDDSREDADAEPALYAEDDFPDVDELLRRRPPPSKGSSVRNTLKSFSTRFKRLQHVGENATFSRQACENINGNVFDLPASPPTSSSPVNVPLPSGWLSSSALLSVPLKEPDSPWPAQDDPHVSEIGALPTPMTSTTKPPPRSVMFVESESDEHDPFAEALESSQNTSASSDESVEIRRVSKKIRGVLPASHLRLDLQHNKASRRKPSFRDSQSLSPTKSSNLRGIALPRASSTTRRHISTEGFLFMSDESEDNSDGVDERGLNMRYDSGDEVGTLVDDQSRLGFAEEEDRIDAMLPTRKRKPKRFKDIPRKRSRLAQKSIEKGRLYKRQPKIANHFSTLQKATPHHKIVRGFVKRSKTQPRKQMITPPKLSILDVIDNAQPLPERVPHFLRVAARAASLRKDMGRQSPSRKFIRLAIREDTVDAQLLLNEWKSGRIQPRSLNQSIAGPSRARRSALLEVSNNRQARLTSPTPKAELQFQPFRIAQRRGTRRLLVSEPVQSTVDEFVTASHSVPKLYGNATKNVKSMLAKALCLNARNIINLSRPAQLELAEAEYSRPNPAATFRKTKKALDALYRYGRKMPAPETSLPMSRFLDDNDVIRPSIEKASSPQPIEITSTQGPGYKLLRRATKPRKRTPHRIDASAAQYRQPSEPLVLDHPSIPLPESNERRSKLTGLGKFGTGYPRDFDVRPLQSGIFFDKSTFIGSGRLSHVIKRFPGPSSHFPRTWKCFWLGEKEFRWGPWNENVSCELGLYFDWLIERLESTDDPATEPCLPKVNDTLTCIVDYLQYHVSFSTALDCKDACSRISEVLLDFWMRLDQAVSVGIEDDKLKCMTEIATICALISMQALLLARRGVEQAIVETDLERLLEKFAQLSVKLLLSHGLEDIRKLYDSLQYLAVRRNGIGREQYAAQAWIILWTVLDAAKIPRASFWDVTNTQLKIAEVISTNDAQALERLWYSTLSLIPLCEFDESGAVIANRRHTASFDNWSLPQCTLKAVLGLYKSSPRQAPSFNDYCRAIVGRCHYLMVEWGWWESRSLIGTLFDFFASQNLAHLRNEEVHKSPGFLEELDAEPTLALEADDKCFHIFLKVLALAIKHMRHANNKKGIRNLVARVLPNHGRQYPKEEDIQERELASLRNHHDLLCTIYWASPADQRSTPDVVDLLEKLVDPTRSHKAACLINLRSWGNLARFAISLLNTDSSPSTLEAYKPFIGWQTRFFMQLFEQYLGAEKEAYAQADLSRVRESILETRLQLVIAINRRSTLDVLRQCLVEMSHVLDSAQSVTALLQAFNAELIREIWTPSRWGCEGMEKEIGSGSIEVLNKYIDRLEALKPVSELRPNDPVELDSQDSMFSTFDADRQTLIYPLSQHVLANFSAVLRSILECQVYRKTEPSSIQSMIRVWGRMSCVVTENTTRLREFTNTGTYAIFEHRKQHTRAMKWWPLFLSMLVETKPLPEFAAADLNLELEWLLAITQPSCFQVNAFALSEQLRMKGCYYFAPLDRSFEQYRGVSVGAVRDAGTENCLSASNGAQLSQRLIKSAIINMRDIIKNSNDSNSLSGRDLKRKESEALCSNLLLEMMTSMKRNLESLIPSSNSHIDYVTFCQQIIALVRSHASDVRPVIDFFVRPSMYYWPEKSDPKLYAAGLVSYTIRLSEHPEKTSFELFYYLYNGWKSHAMNALLGDHTAFVYDAMKHIDFVNFIILDFLPAALSLGFSVPFGWIISADHLPALARLIPRLFKKFDTDKTSATFERIVNLTRILMNGILRTVCSTSLTRDMAFGQEQGIVSLSCQFLLSVRPTLMTYADGRLTATMRLEDTYSIFDEFMRNYGRLLRGYVVSTRSAQSLEVMEGKHIRRFADIISDDIKKSWIVQEDMRILIQGTGANHHGGFVDLDMWRQHIPPLSEIIKSYISVPSEDFMRVLF